ncbi:hypothetical protein, partial [Dialister succinatiphilus]|uniref:hypothetical protein n=1 Tax=Dialister succinatiphilus TaxID=487173 RepID=UPI004024E0D5
AFGAIFYTAFGGENHTTALRASENRPASLCSCNGFPLARFAGLPPQAVAEQPVLIVVQLMKGLLCESLLSHRSAGGRWCRKAPKGEKPLKVAHHRNAYQAI